MWLRLRRGKEGGYRPLATVEDTPENYTRMTKTITRMWTHNHTCDDYITIVRLASLYQDERLPVSHNFVNRKNRRAERKLIKVRDRKLATLEKKLAWRPVWREENLGVVTAD